MPQDHAYSVSGMVGSSAMSIDDAIRMAVGKATRTKRHVRWFEVVETRGHVEDGHVAHIQVTLKVGFTLDDEQIAPTVVICGCRRHHVAELPRRPKRHLPGCQRFTDRACRRELGRRHTDVLACHDRHQRPGAGQGVL